MSLKASDHQNAHGSVPLSVTREPEVAATSVWQCCADGYTLSAGDASSPVSLSHTSGRGHPHSESLQWCAEYNSSSVKLPLIAASAHVALHVV